MNEAQFFAVKMRQLTAVHRHTDIFATLITSIKYCCHTSDSTKRMLRNGKYICSDDGRYTVNDKVK